MKGLMASFSSCHSGSGRKGGGDRGGGAGAGGPHLRIFTLWLGFNIAFILQESGRKHTSLSVNAA